MQDGIVVSPLVPCNILMVFNKLNIPPPSACGLDGVQHFNYQRMIKK